MNTSFYVSWKPAEDSKGKWRDVTDSFLEKRRYYKDTYLEICEEDAPVECSLFSRENGPNEIYFSFGNFYGIVYANREEAEDIRAEMMEDLQGGRA